MSLFGGGKQKQLEDQLFNMKMMIKILSSHATKMKKKYNSTVAKIRKAIKESDNESALLLADHAVQQRKLQLRYTKLSLKMDIIASVTQSSLETQHTTNSIANVIQTVTSIKDPTTVVSEIERFEALFDDLNITTNTVENTLDSSTSMSSLGSQEASTLISQIRDSVAIEDSSLMPIINHKIVNEINNIKLT